METKKGIPEDFDFEQFSKEAATRLKKGEELTGKGGIQSYYKSVKGVGAKAKTMTNNLPILSVLPLVFF